jgi:S-adenosylmethionine decarboxylase
MRYISHAMKTDGLHLLCELSGCNRETLMSAEAVRRALESAAAAARATILNAYVHPFGPSGATGNAGMGVSGVLCLAESHISIHTWPEHAYAAADIYTCGDATQPHAAIQVLAQALEARDTVVREIARGISEANGRFTNKS